MFDGMVPSVYPTSVNALAFRIWFPFWPELQPLPVVERTVVPDIPGADKAVDRAAVVSAVCENCQRAAVSRGEDAVDLPAADRTLLSLLNFSNFGR